MWQDASVDEFLALLFQGELEPDIQAGGDALFNTHLTTCSSPPCQPDTACNARCITTWLPQQQPCLHPTTFEQQSSLQHVNTGSNNGLSSSQQHIRALAAGGPVSFEHSSTSSSHLSHEGSSAAHSITRTSTGDWQTAIDNIFDNATPATLNFGASTGRRGRKPANGISAKPVKDKKRDNRIMIQQLEQELAKKLTIMQALEQENEHLKRKEKVLQISVDTSTQNIERLVDPQLDNNLKSVLRSFRSSYNRAAANQVLSKIAHIQEPKDFTFEVFCSCWTAMVLELSDGMMAETAANSEQAKKEAETYGQQLHARMVDFIMALCAHDPLLPKRAICFNLVTGEFIGPPTVEQYMDLLDKLGLTDDQLRDMAGVWELSMKSTAKLSAECKLSLEQLNETVVCHETLPKSITANPCKRCSDLGQVSERLSGNVSRTFTIHIMVAFAALRILTRKQTAQLCMHASPSFPSVKLLAMCANHKAQVLGLVPIQPPGFDPLAVAQRAKCCSKSSCASA